MQQHHRRGRQCRGDITFWGPVRVDNILCLTQMAHLQNGLKLGGVSPLPHPPTPIHSEEPIHYFVFVSEWGYRSMAAGLGHVRPFFYSQLQLRLHFCWFG